MKKILPLLIVLALFGGMSAAALESVHMLDGSVLQGEVLSMTGETLFLKTGYSDALELPRAQIAAILFDEGFAVPGTQITTTTRMDKPVVLDGVGKVELTFTGRDARSSMSYKSERERKRMEEINAIVTQVFVDDEEVYSFIDDKMDKEFKKGSINYLRNTCKLQPISLDLPAGEHDIRIVVGNRFELVESDEDLGDLITADLFIEKMMVKPDRTTRLIVKGHGSRVGYGSFSMELLSTR